MDARHTSWYDDDSEAGSPSQPKRRKIFHDGLSHGVYGHPGAPLTTRYEQYTFAWICALPLEKAAACAMLDEVHGDLPWQANDSNTYTLGSIQGHKIVIACLPQYGTNHAAIVLTNLTRTFPSVHLGLMVGIGGGIPSKADIRLGDIVVGTRVMQCDLGKFGTGGQFQPTAAPKTLDKRLGTAVAHLRSKHELEPSRIPSILHEKLGTHPKFGRPGSPDRLFQSTYSHESASACDECDQSKLVPRSQRVSGDPVIHYGGIASGNQVMKDPRTRDSIARKLDVICFEMEAAGLMDILPCVAIRGICDYSDTHKNKEWQRYAAGTAAAYARELLEAVPAAGEHSATPMHSPDNTYPISSRRHRKRLLDSLKFSQIDSRMLNIRRAHAKTCRWFLHHPDYKAWVNPEQLANNHGFLWVRGKPGSGKSTMMKFIYSNMRKSRSGAGVTASFFFNARGEGLQKSTLGMYRSLLLQLLEGFPDLQAVLDDPVLVSPDQVNGSLIVLKDLFRSAVSSLDHRSFTCFVDALDECDEQQVMDMVEYFEELAEYATEKGTPLRVCFSSRHYPYIDVRVGIQLTLEDQPGHVNDLANYVQSRLRVKDPALVEELQPQILEKAAGVFLWVVLVVDILNEKNRHGRLALRKTLREVPRGLSELFKDILRRDNENMEDLLLCVLWVLFAKRPLRPKEYFHALWSGLYLKGLADPEVPNVTAPDTLDTIERFVISSSKGLAEITVSKEPTVQFIHESVRDFLVKDNGLYELWPDLGFAWDSPSHEILKQCCETYLKETYLSHALLSQPDTMELALASDLKNNMEEHPFLEYTTHYVLHHANAAADAVPQHQFLSQFPRRGWICISNFFEKYMVRKYSDCASLLYVLAEKGLPELIRTRLKEEHPHTRISGQRYEYPLFAALANGDADSVAALMSLQPGTCDEAKFMEGLGRKGDFRRYENRTPLSWAAQEGRIELARLLLQAGVAVGEFDGNHRTPLLRASENDEGAMVRLLIHKGADVNTRAKDGSTPLSWALLCNDMDLVEFLIENGADVNIPNMHGWTGLMTLSEAGYENGVKLFVESGAYVDFQDNNGLTALIEASSNGHEAVARFLIEKGTDVNMSTRGGSTALMEASSNGYEAVVRLLIEKGAHIDAQNKDGYTSLIWALTFGHEAVARMLIENGARVDVQDNRGRTALMEASRKGYQAIAQLLVGKGTDINLGDKKGTTSLIHASIFCREAIVSILVENGAHVDVRDEDGRTALLETARRGSKVIAELLVKKGADVNLDDLIGTAPLMQALASRHGDIAEILIKNGADINQKNGIGWTPLFLASKFGLEDVASLLIQNGATD